MSFMLENSSAKCRETEREHFDKCTGIIDAVCKFIEPKKIWAYCCILGILRLLAGPVILFKLSVLYTRLQ